MYKFRFRPWGRPDWLRPYYGGEPWCILACHGTELRSAKSVVNLASDEDSVVLVQINDPQKGTEREEDERSKAYDRNLRLLNEKLASPPQIEREDLKASLDRIWAICDQACAVSQNVIIDITSFPKRWFFPMLRHLLSDKGPENLQAVYTAGKHPSGALAENPELLRALPSFAEARQNHDVAFVGVGFHTHSMLELFSEDEAKSLQLVFPFPPGPPGIHRNMRFVEEVERKVQRDKSLPEGMDPIGYMHLDAIDVSQAFDAIMMKTGGGKKTSVMAPYGPKPFSLAMCLYALAVENADKPEVPVFYSQPKKYAVDYTTDAITQNGTLDSWSYALKKGGNLIYKI